MTICIAAICDNNKTVVVASDRMITSGFLAMEFEHPESKIDKLTATCIGLTAGDMIASTELFRSCRTLIQQLQAPSVELISNRFKDQFAYLRRQWVEERVLKPRGLTFDEFYQHGGMNRLQSELAFSIDRQVQSSEYPVEVIIAGVDGSGAHIYSVTDPGVTGCYDRLGYHAIGTGRSHALFALIGDEHDRSRGINETVYLVYESKRRAEVAQGVGDKTDMGIITLSGTRLLGEEEINRLREIYEEKTSPQLEKVRQSIAKMSFVERTEDGND